MPSNFHLKPDWPAPPNVHAFTTLRHGAGSSQPPFDSFNLGMRAGDDAEVVARNRAELIERFGLPSTPCWLQQVHGNAVHCFTNPSPALRAPSPARGEGNSNEPVADASVTSSSNVVLAILTADCMPVLFTADDGSEVAAAHAGWRGLSGGVLENTITAMHSDPAKIIAWLGPAAGPQAYEIGEEVFDAFVSRDVRATSAFSATRAGHWHVDLYALARQRLSALGVKRVYGGDLCTISDPQRFYSHRRDQRTGRMATLVWRSER